jgi:hypothetical protein
MTSVYVGSSIAFRNVVLRVQSLETTPFLACMQKYKANEVAKTKISSSCHAGIVIGMVGSNPGTINAKICQRRSYPFSDSIQVIVISKVT